MNKEIEALKPCPFCGGEAAFDQIEMQVQCKQRNCTGQSWMFDTHEQAITAWNTRQAADQLERYRVALESISVCDISINGVIARQALDPKP